MSNLFSSGGAGNVGFSGETQQSLKFNDDESQYLSWTPAAAGNRKTWTWSGWVKRGNLGTWQTVFSAGTGSDHVAARFTDSTNLFQFYNFSSPSYNWKIDTVAVFRDASAFYHLVLQVDSTQATSTDRIKIYINGERQTLSGSYPSLNFDSDVNTAQPHKIGAGINNDFLFDGYLSDINFIDGQALDASNFGQFTNGYWKAKDYAGTYGTNGFHLTFEDDVVSEGFNAVTYRGTGATQSISGLGFEPDFVWLKSRTSGGQGHRLIDTVRGAPLSLKSHATDAEFNDTTGLTSFNADGFTLGTLGDVNTSGNSYVGWCWDAGSGSAASNTDGSITSTVKANPDYGFSVVNYVATGSNATVGHGLTSAPEFIIVKHRDQALTSWVVYYGDNTDYLRLNSTVASIDAVEAWNDTSPTSTVFSVGANGGDTNNTSGGNTIAYCFHSVAGYSSIGSYTGNGSASGPTVTTGFAPAFVMVKRTDNAGGWNIIDNTRDVNTDLRLQANTADAEAALDTTFTNTGFILDTTASSINASGGTYIYMAFADTREAAFWKDVSGQGNHWTPNNLDYRDSLIDSPANNFATLNATFATSNSASTGGTLSEGNLRITTTGGFFKGGTFAPSSGKWYFEGYAESVGAQMSISFADYSAIQTGYPYVGYLSGGGLHQIDGSAQDSAGTHATWTSGDIISVAVDIDAGKIWWAKNGTYIDSGDPAAGTNAPTTFTAGTEVVPYFMCDNASGTKTWKANFGQDSTFSGERPAGGNTDANNIGDFAYAPPSGYLALCTANLPTPTIVDGSEHFNTVLYTGTGATQSITGVGFGSAPDFVWIKDRTTAYDHHLFDVVRGGGNSLYSNDTVAENTYATDITFEADGFSVANGSGVPQIYINKSGDSYAAWNWKAGGAAVSNTSGSITSQVSANTDAGFSVVSYTGTGSSTTTGHSLNSPPELVIIKDRDSAQDWNVYHADVGTTNILALNSTSAAYADGAAMINSTAPTSSVVHIGFGGASNGSGRDYIAYCFHSVDGFSKVGSYTGNGSTDGPFVYTGFRPAWIMVKNSSLTGTSWLIWDVERNAYNIANDILKAQSSNAEVVNNNSFGIDILANGFKVRSSYGDVNQSGNTIIYLAFAETPQKFANAR